MGPTGSSEECETASLDISDEFESASPDSQYDEPAEKEPIGTASAEAQESEARCGEKRIVVWPGVSSIRFPYDYRLEKQKAIIRSLNEDMGW